MKLQNPFRTGLLAGLGVLVAVLIGAAVGNLAAIITYVGAALFLALGLDPLVSWLERHRVRRPFAILITLVGVLGVFTGLVFALIPVIVEQVQTITTFITDTVIPTAKSTSDLNEFLEKVAPWLDRNVTSFIVNGVTDWVSDGNNITALTNGVLSAGVATANGVFGGIIVLILVIYFVSSLATMKRGIYQLVPASKRETFIDLSEQISQAVGRYVMGQVSLALINGVISIILLSSLGITYGALLAFIAFLGSLIPLVGTLSASLVIILSTFLFTDLGTDGYWHTIVVAIWYLVYMQIESYVLNPRIMARAVKVPGVIVVIAALVGGTLLGVLGALIAIPVAASVLLIVNQVMVPRQAEL
ncbi:AI-2E family transporter [Galbitalea sp. SE-J8]|nr:AI-2E family transporter [Galbitalea sp. SE-J8]MDM4764345.1 AI-2E family transporter [Galbitalea sp. SE-J8]